MNQIKPDAASNNQREDEGENHFHAHTVPVNSERQARECPVDGLPA
jgi:hypothetical protein